MNTNNKIKLIETLIASYKEMDAVCDQAKGILGIEVDSKLMNPFWKALTAMSKRCPRSLATILNGFRGSSGRTTVAKRAWRPVTIKGFARLKPSGSLSR